MSLNAYFSDLYRKKRINYSVDNFVGNLGG